jgi:hypothetical protein
VTRFIRHLTRSRAPAAGTLLLGLAIFHVWAPVRAWAYLDPITGSIVLQVLAAGFVAGMATFRRTREWFAGLFRRRTADPES